MLHLEIVYDRLTWVNSVDDVADLFKGAPMADPGQPNDDGAADLRLSKPAAC